MFIDKVLEIWSNPDETYKNKFAPKGMPIRTYLDTICMVKEGVPNFSILKSELYKESKEYSNEQLVEFNALLKIFTSLEFGYQQGKIPSEFDSVLGLMVQLRAAEATPKDDDRFPKDLELKVRSIPVLDFIKKFSVIDSAISFNGELYKAVPRKGVHCFIYNQAIPNSPSDGVTTIGDIDFANRVQAKLGEFMNYKFPVLVIAKELVDKIDGSLMVGDVLVV